MSVAAEQDASEVEGAMKKKDVTYQAKKASNPEADADNKPAPSKTAKSSWGVEGQKSAKADAETPLQTDFEYNFDEPDEADAVGAGGKGGAGGDDDEELSTQVAEPPKMLAHKVQTMKELESLAKFNLPQAKEAGIDIALLTNTLAPQYQVHERDELWDFEELFVSLAAELDAELTEKQEPPKDAGAAAAAEEDAGSSAGAAGSGGGGGGGGSTPATATATDRK